MIKAKEREGDEVVGVWRTATVVGSLWRKLQDLRRED